MCPLSKKYYDDCSNVLASLIVRAVFPRFAHPSAALSKLGSSSLQSAASRASGMSSRPSLRRGSGADGGSSPHGIGAGEPTRSSGSAEDLARLGGKEELRCVVAVFRHGDRTPKQKLKMVSRHPLFCGMLT